MRCLWGRGEAVVGLTEAEELSNEPSGPPPLRLWSSTAQTQLHVVIYGRVNDRGVGVGVGGCSSGEAPEQVWSGAVTQPYLAGERKAA